MLISSWNPRTYSTRYPSLSFWENNVKAEFSSVGEGREASVRSSSEEEEKRVEPMTGEENEETKIGWTSPESFPDPVLFTFTFFPRSDPRRRGRNYIAWTSRSYVCFTRIWKRNGEGTKLLFQKRRNGKTRTLRTLSAIRTSPVKKKATASTSNNKRQCIRLRVDWLIILFGHLTLALQLQGQV